MIQCIYLNDRLEKDLMSACRLRLPDEACGVVYGDAISGVSVVDGFAIVRNIADRRTDRFRFHPEDWISIVYEAQKKQRNIAGIFHSHPQGPALPSLEDELGWTPWGSYWIVSLAGETGEIAAFSRDNGQQWLPIPIKRDRDLRRTAENASIAFDCKVCI